MFKKFGSLFLVLMMTGPCVVPALAYTRDYDLNSPVDHTLNNQWPTNDRRVKQDVSERLTDQLYGFTSGETTIGVKSLRFIDQVSNPSTVTDVLQLYGKAVGGKTELFFKDEDGNAVQVTSAGTVNVATQTPTGAMLMWGTTSAPSGWLICDGSAVSRTTYATLFAVIGTNFGIGDGSTTFNLPNFKGKNAIGYNASNTAFDAMGETGGEESHTQSIAEMPAHTHTYSTPPTPGAGGSGGSYSGTPTSATSGSTGGGVAFNVLDPYLAVNFIIKY